MLVEGRQSPISKTFSLCVDLGIHQDLPCPGGAAACAGLATEVEAGVGEDDFANNYLPKPRREKNNKRDVGLCRYGGTHKFVVSF